MAAKAEASRLSSGCSGGGGAAALAPATGSAKAASVMTAARQSRRLKRATVHGRRLGCLPLEAASTVTFKSSAPESNCPGHSYLDDRVR